MAKPTVAPSGPRIVILDIETAPLDVHVWGIWEQNVNLEQINEDWTILSFTAKTHGSNEIVYADTGGRGVDKVRDDRELLKKLWDVLDAADVVVTQNGKAFDVPRINARLIMNGFPPYSPIRIVDTKLIAKRHFDFISNKLEYLSKKLTKTAKSSHKKFPGFKLWTECLKDNPKAWAEMKKYNTRDVLATERVWLRLRPWTDNHPNVAIYSDDAMACPKCGSKSLRKNGRAFTQSGEYQRFRCLKCGGFSRERSVTRRKKSLTN